MHHGDDPEAHCPNVLQTECELHTRCHTFCSLAHIAVFLSSIAVALALASLVQNGNDPEGQPEGNWAVLQQGSNTVYISGTPVGSPLQ